MTDQPEKKLKLMVGNATKIAIEINDLIRSKHVSLSEAGLVFVMLFYEFKQRHPDLHAEIVAMADRLEKE